ncbi:MAG: DNA polymerase III subunit delta [Coriobacteriia bacterium]|nr:DNA polymerase III subunit delta [Coriobacteriia bacterium]
MADLLAAYLIVGDDELRQQKALEKLKSYIPEKAQDFDLNRFDATEALDIDELSASLNAFPLMADKRLVIIEHGEKLSKEIQEALIVYLKNPLETTILALASLKLAKNTRLYKAFQAISASSIVELQSKKAWQMPQYAQKLAASLSLTLDSFAAQELVSRLGTSTILIESELKKLQLMYGEGQTITKKIIEEQVARVEEVKPWDFTAALSERNLIKALDLYQQMRTQSELVLLSMSLSRIRELMVAKALEQRAQAHRLAEVLGMQAWQIKNHQAWQANFTMEELTEALVSAADCEQKLKSQADKSSIFLDWLLNVLREA